MVWIEWVKLLLPSTLAVIAIFISVNLSLRKDQRQIVWEKKFKSYISTIEALIILKNDIDKSYDIEITRQDHPQVTEEDKKKFTEALWEVTKHADLGHLIMSDQALHVFEKFKKELGISSQQPTYFECLDYMLFAIDECLNNLKKIARKELTQ